MDASRPDILAAAGMLVVIACAADAALAAWRSERVARRVHQESLRRELVSLRTVQPAEYAAWEQQAIQEIEAHLGRDA